MSVQEMVDLHVSEGWTPNALASISGMSPNGVRERLKRHGAYVPRPYGQNSKAKGYHKTKGYINELVTPEWPYFTQMARKFGRNNNKCYIVLQHRKIMADHLGRALLPTETVHHINGKKDDNRLENLQLRQGKHGNGEVYRCRCCGSQDIESVPL